MLDPALRSIHSFGPFAPVVYEKIVREDGHEGGEEKAKLSKEKSSGSMGAMGWLKDLVGKEKVRSWSERGVGGQGEGGQGGSWAG